ncbi:hypothetical protein [Paenibacillus sp. PAMC21692]|uniref:hypothetical protein n=1 Tax=Paenibacillus sp. PAMC21692 TaxID=2762320 RepID=UPI00164E681F|nr:hypothetical protein [Paenibacillus sp. PAMC21692]QNK59199.1 hypothetical protein H7F31_10180 [Paenibacillus sp. PAMC21692]
MAFPNKKEYVAHVVGLFSKVADQYGFVRENGLSFTRKQSDEVEAGMAVQVAITKLPASVVVLLVDVSLRLASVAELCEQLFARDRAIATIGGPLGRFTERDDFVTEYRFDWKGDEDRVLGQLDADIHKFSRFAESINSAQSLDAGRLARLPGLRKNFSLGLGETYKYTVPEVAAVLHRLNGKRDEAMRTAAIAERNKSGRLSAEQLNDLRRYVSEMD